MSPVTCGAIRIDTRARQRERGAALVELAITLPILMVVLLGAIDFGRAFRLAMIVTNAARAGAQFGAQTSINSGNTTQMINTADQLLSANGLASGPATTAQRLCECADDAGNFTATTPANTCASTSCPTGHLSVWVTVTASRTFSMLTPFPGLPSSVTITRGATARAQ